MQPHRLSAVVPAQPMEAPHEKFTPSQAGSHAGHRSCFVVHEWTGRRRGKRHGPDRSGLQGRYWADQSRREEQAPSQSSEVINIPTPEESRRALMEPISKQPSLGEHAERAASGGANFRRSKHAAGIAKCRRRSARSHHGRQRAGFQRVEDRIAQAASATIATLAASGEPPPSGPIGSFGETIPAKFSKRNDILDRTPIMALPLPLSDQQRKQIYDAVMADNSQPVAGADALKPASELSTEPGAQWHASAARERPRYRWC